MILQEMAGADSAAQTRTRKLYDTIKQLRSEEERLKMQMEEYVQQEIAYGGDESSARFDYQDEFPEEAARMREIEMTIEDAFDEIEELGDLPYD